MGIKMKGRVVNLDDTRIPWRFSQNAYAIDRGKCKNLIGEDGLRSDDLVLAVGFLEPGEVHQEHRHYDRSEFYFFLRGKGKVILEKDSWPVSAYSCVYIPAGEKHGIVNDSKDVIMVVFGYNRPGRGHEFDSSMDTKANDIIK
jgi:mannose-6-phosphate isomerase-like protein (cupin superfamily)